MKQMKGENEMSRKKNSVVLAEGEVTGHFHEATGAQIALDNDVLSVPNGANVKHQEHKQVELPPGTYNRGIVKEWDQFAEEAREIED